MHVAGLRDERISIRHFLDRDLVFPAVYGNFEFTLHESNPTLATLSVAFDDVEHCVSRDVRPVRQRPIPRREREY